MPYLMHPTALRLPYAYAEADCHKISSFCSNPCHAHLHHVPTLQSGRFTFCEASTTRLASPSSAGTATAPTHLAANVRGAL